MMLNLSQEANISFFLQNITRCAVQVFNKQVNNNGQTKLNENPFTFYQNYLYMKR